MVFDDIDFNRTSVDFGDAHINIYHAKKTPENETKSDIYKVIYHSHFYFELHLLLDGTCRFFINDKCICLSGKQVLVIPPFVDHSPFNEYGAPNEVVFAILFEKTQGEKGFYDYFISALNSSTPEPISVSEHLFSELVSLSSLFSGNTILDYCKRKVKAYEVMQLLFSEFGKSGQDKTFSAYEDLKLFALENLVNSYDISLADMSKKLGYTPRHTARLINRIYGRNLSAIRFYNMTTSARKLLVSDPGMPLSRVAKESGFSSLAVMNREFFKREGMTPSEYRKKNVIAKMTERSNDEK